MDAVRSSPLFPRTVAWLIVAATLLLALGLFAAGWGIWGIGGYGDSALDLADALRLHQGDTPYRDFLPTYGPLHMFAVSPLFQLGQAFFPTYWGLTFALLLLELLAISWMVRTRAGDMWAFFAALIFLACVAFVPINGQLMQGYSPSGFLATIGWTVCLLLLWRGGGGLRRWWVVGLVLGLVPFTKMDAGGTAFAALLAMLVVLCFRHRGAAARLAGGFAVGWGGVMLVLFAVGGTPRLIIETAIEGLGNATFFGDAELKRRLLVLFGCGALLAIGWVLPLSRPHYLRARRVLAPRLLWLLPIALAVDAWRGWPAFSLKNLVALNYFWVLVWVLVAARLGGALIRWRSLRVFRFRAWPAVLLACVVAGMGIARVSITGWYPLNYHQPAMLLLAILACSTRPRGRGLGAALKTAMIAATCASFALAWHKMHDLPWPKTWIPTPHGALPVAYDDATRRDLETVLGILRTAPLGEAILCTYEPSAQFMSGLRSAALYTYFGRMGFSGKYQPDRERQAWDLFRMRRPLFVLWDKERAVFSKSFGVDHSRKLAEWIEMNYDKVYTASPQSFMKMQVYRRRDPPPPR